MKKAKGLLCLTALICFAQSTAAFASEATIPSHMAPGTVIHYDANKDMTVVKEGKENSKSLKGNYKASSDLPKVQANTTIVYDGLGGPIVKSSDSNLISSTSTTRSSINAASSHSQQGYVSYYDIWAESTASGTRASDGAAHRTIAFYTSVDVCNEEDNYNNTYVRILDRGPYVSGRILDMSEESFSNIADTDAGVFYGALYW